MGVVSHSCLVLFGDNGVCVLCALTSVGALFLQKSDFLFLRTFCPLVFGIIEIGGIKCGKIKKRQS